MKKTIGLIALATCLYTPAMVYADSSLKHSMIPTFDSKSQQISTPLADVPHIIVAGRGNGGGGNGGGTGDGICDGSGPSS